MEAYKAKYGEDRVTSDPAEQLMMQFICGKQPVKKREVLTQMM